MENILLKLAACIGGCNSIKNDCDLKAININDHSWMWDHSIWSDKVLSALKANVSLLMEAAGERSNALDSLQTLPEMMDIFLIGTKQRKVWKERGPPKYSELGPISRMKFQSVTKIAKCAMGMERGKDCINNSNDISVIDNDSDDDDEMNGLPPQYRKVGSLMEAAGLSGVVM